MFEKFSHRAETIVDKREIDPMLVEEIEALNIGPDLKEEIILVKLGEKPAAWLTFTARIGHEGEEPHTLKSEGDIERIYDTIKRSGLSFEILPRKTLVDEQKIDGKKTHLNRDEAGVLIAGSREKLEELVRLVSDTKNNQELLGRALGIPETAIEAFIGKRKVLNLRTLPKETLTSDAFIFAPTRVFSEDNWRKEILEGQKRAEILKS